MPGELIHCSYYFDIVGKNFVQNACTEATLPSSLGAEFEIRERGEFHILKGMGMLVISLRDLT